MGFLFKRPDSPFYWGCFGAAGRRHRFSTGSKSRRRAKQVLAERETEERSKPVPSRHSRGLTVARLIEIRVDHSVKERGIDLANSHQLRVGSGRLLEWFGATNRAADITQQDINAFIEDSQNKYKPATIRPWLFLLRSAFDMAVDRGEFDRRDVPHVRIIKQPDNVRRRNPSREELQKFVEHCDPWLSDYVFFSYLTGWRKGEVLGLRWRDYSRQDKTLRLESTKNGEPRVLPLGGPVANVIAARREAQNAIRLVGRDAHIFTLWEDGKKTEQYTLDWHWKKALKASGLEKFTPHDLRRSAAVLRTQIQGHDPDSVARLLGWKNTKMLSRYNIVGTKRIRAIVEADDMAVALTATDTATLEKIER